MWKFNHEPIIRNEFLKLIMSMQGPEHWEERNQKGLYEEGELESLLLYLNTWPIRVILKEE